MIICVYMRTKRNVILQEFYNPLKKDSFRSTITISSEIVLQAIRLKTQKGQPQHCTASHCIVYMHTKAFICKLYFQFSSLLISQCFALL